MVNDRPTRAFVDTGSTVTFVSLQHARNLRLRIDTSQTITIKQVNSLTSSIGRVTFKLTISNKTLMVRAWIMEFLTFPLLLGLDIGELFDMHICMKERRVFFIDEGHQTTLTAINTNISGGINSLDQVLIKYQEVFAQHDKDIGRITIAKHHIRAIDHPPIQLRVYRHSIQDNEFIRNQIKDLKTKGLIRDSNSPWSFPVTLAKKKDGTKRLCIDYRRLNAITIDERMPIPLVQDVIDRTRNARFFTTLDVAWGYWHVEIDPNSIEKTAFITVDGHYEWLVLPFGLKSAPNTFQRIIQRVLGDLLFDNVITYLDDIIIFNKTMEQHCKLLDKVLQRFVSAHVKLRKPKCQFSRSEVEYLGHVIGKNFSKPATSKIEAVRNFSQPTSVNELQRFVGLAGYYRRFIKDFTIKAYPLTQIIGGKLPFTWATEQQRAFAALRDALITEPVLVTFDPHKCIVHTDASKIAMSGILMQLDEYGKKHVVAYFSKRMNKDQERYTTTEQECLAVITTVEHFHVYLHGKPFDIYTDHVALQWLFTRRKPTGRLFHWSVRLSMYSYTIHHRPGVNMKAADALSRIAVNTAITSEELQKAQVDMDITSIKKPSKYNNLITIRKNGIHRAVVPHQPREKILTHYHDEHGHPGINKTAKLALQFYWWRDAFKDIKTYVKSCTTCQKVKQDHRPALGVQQPIETPPLPMILWAMDTIVMGSAANSTRAKYVQLIIDHHSRYVWAFATPKNTAQTSITILERLFQTIGKPQRLITDNGTNFTSRSFRAKLYECGVKHSLISSYHPQANGLCEKANHTIITRVKLALDVNPRKKWSTHLTEVTQQYNDTPHDATGFPPRYLQFGIVNSPEFAKIIPLETALPQPKLDRIRLNLTENRRSISSTNPQTST